MENLSFLFAAYSVTWVALFLYVWSLWRKQNRIAEEIQRLKEKIEDNGS
jgi:CcmD family protein